VRRKRVPDPERAERFNRELHKTDESHGWISGRLVAQQSTNREEQATEKKIITNIDIDTRMVGHHTAPLN